MMINTIILLVSILLLHSASVCVFYLLQDRYVLSGLVFLCCLAIENAVVAAFIPDPNTQKRVDKICFYVALVCFLVLQIMALAFVIKKVRIFFSDWLLILLDVWVESQVFSRRGRLLVDCAAGKIPGASVVWAGVLERLMRVARANG